MNHRQSTHKANGFAPKKCPAKKWFKYQAQSIWSLENSLLTIYCSSPGTTQPVFQDVSKQKETYVKRRLSACWSTAMIIAMRMSVGPKPSSCKTSTIRISWKWNDQCANHQAVNFISTWKMVILGNITGRYFIISYYRIVNPEAKALSI